MLCSLAAGNERKIELELISMGVYVIAKLCQIYFTNDISFLRWQLLTVMAQAWVRSERKIRDERDCVASEGRVEALNVDLSVTEDGWMDGWRG